MTRPADRRRFRFHGSSILVSSTDDASLDWLEGFLLPSFDVPSPLDPLKSNAQYEVGYVVDPQRFATLRRGIMGRSTETLPCFALDTETVRLPAVREADRTMLLDEPHGCVLLAGRGSIEIVADPAAARRRLTLLRAVREIAAEAWRRQEGRLELHAAALAIDDAVILLAGAKNAGKTTSLVHALRTSSARLVANDRVAIRLDGDRVAVRGMPTVVSIRSGTLASFPSILREIPAHAYPWSLNDAEWRAARKADDLPARQEYLRLSPARFAAQLGCELVGGGRLGAIVVCRLDPEVPGRSVEPLSRQAARAALAICLYGRESRRGEATVVETFVGGTVPDDVRRSVEVVAEIVPVFECRLGPAAYDDPFDFSGLLESRAEEARGLRVSLPALAERLGAEVVELRPLSSSSAPGPTARARRAVLSDGRVVKVRRLERHEDAAVSGRILAALGDRGFASLLDSWGETAVEEWVEGEPLADPPPEDAVRQAGDLLGRLHARESLDGVELHRMAPTARDLWRVEHDLAILRRIAGLEEAIVRHLLAAALDADPGETMVGLCHLDFCGENMVLDAHGRLRVVDNASMSVGPLDFDLQRTAYRWRLSADRWEVFLRAYRAHREPNLGCPSTLFWRLRAVTLSARFRLAGGAASAALPLSELRKLYDELAENS